MSLCVATYFTKRWTYCAASWSEHLRAALDGFAGTLIVSTDHSQESLDSVNVIKNKIKEFPCVHVISEIQDGHTPYKTEAQKVIATIQQKAFSAARDLKCNAFWSVESDVLVPPNALKILRQALEFDEGYYDVAMVTYPNGLFLGGRGTPEHQISPDTYDDERLIPKELSKKLKKIKVTSKETAEEYAKLREQVQACPPKGIFLSYRRKNGEREDGWRALTPA